MDWVACARRAGDEGAEGAGSGRDELEGRVEKDEHEHGGANRRLSRRRDGLDEVLIHDAIAVRQYRE